MKRQINKRTGFTSQRKSGIWDGRSSHRDENEKAKLVSQLNWKKTVVTGLDGGLSLGTEVWAVRGDLRPVEGDRRMTCLQAACLPQEQAQMLANSDQLIQVNEVFFSMQVLNPVWCAR